LVYKPTGREALADRGNQLWAYPQDKPRHFDAWDVEDDYAERGEEVRTVESLELVENTPSRAQIRLVRRYRASTIVQFLTLGANSQRLDVRTQLNWRDRHIFLRALTAVAVRSANATFECAFGVISRSTHANNSWDEAAFEVAAHRFADLSEPGFGVAVLNDGKYGHSVRGNVLGLSLLRSPAYPDPLADEGDHEFVYALMPHGGTWYEGGVREQAEALNQPLLTLETRGLAQGVTRPLSVSGIDAGLAALKAAEDGKGLILRVYEPAGRRGEFKMAVSKGWEAARAVNLLEEPSTGTRDDLSPFQVRSFHLTKSA
jgi:alpha-mannosidase